MKSSTLKRRIQQKGGLPTLPRIYGKVQQLINDPTSGMGQVGAAAAEDPPLVARLLRTANSAFYGLKSTVVSAGHAATIIGEEDLRELMNQVEETEGYRDLEPREGFDPLELWRHARLSARLVSELPPAFHRDQNLELLETAALMHDIGQFAMLHSLGREYTKLCAHAVAKGLPVERVEKKVLGFDHTEIGATLGKRWNLHPTIVDAIRDHSLDTREALVDPAVASVRLADVLATCVLRGEREKLFRRLPGPIVTEYKLDKGAAEALAERAEFLRLYMF